MQKTRHLCIEFLHKYLVLVEATGFEANLIIVKPFIYKGLSHPSPYCPHRKKPCFAEFFPHIIAKSDVG